MHNLYGTRNIHGQGKSENFAPMPIVRVLINHTFISHWSHK